MKKRAILLIFTLLCLYLTQSVQFKILCYNSQDYPNVGKSVINFNDPEGNFLFNGTMTARFDILEVNVSFNYLIEYEMSESLRSTIPFRWNPTVALEVPINATARKLFAQSHGFSFTKIVEGVLNPTIVNDTGNLFFVYSILTFTGENGTQIIEWTNEITISVGQSGVFVSSTRNITVSPVYIYRGPSAIILIPVAIVLMISALFVTCVMKRKER